MASIVIVTDSSADIDAPLRESLGIEVVPLKISFKDQIYIDGVTIGTTQFYDMLKETDVLPKTSQPSPLDFADKYKQIADKYGSDVQIIALLLSSALSGTYQSAVLAKSMLDESLDITVIDSRKASFVHGYIAVEAARAVRNGQTKQQVLDLIHRLLDEIQVYFIVDTLEYLQKGGRIGKASALIGSLLNIKPILTLDSAGTVSPFEKVRGTKKAIARMIEQLQTFAQTDPVKVAVAHSAAREEAEALLEKLKAAFHVEESFVVEIGPVIGTHIGPGTLACMMFRA